MLNAGVSSVPCGTNPATVGSNASTPKISHAAARPYSRHAHRNAAPRPGSISAHFQTATR